MEKESATFKQGMSCILSLLSFLLVITTTIIVWPYIASYLTPKSNTNPGEADSTKNTTNSNLVAVAAVAPSAQTPCTAPGTFKESCLDDLWKSAGCNTSVKAAMDGLGNGKTFATQLNYWNGNTLGDVWDDMKLWSTNTGDLWKKACRG